MHRLKSIGQTPKIGYLAKQAELAELDQLGATVRDNRLFVNTVLYRCRPGVPWCDPPERFGDFCVVHTRHSRSSEGGVSKRISEALPKDADNEYAMIDSTIVQAHQHSAVVKK
jgi:transposase